jgi:hypothetical protein
VTSDRGDYWTIDVPGLTEEAALALLEFARDKLGLAGYTVDPTRSLVAYMDPATVRIVVRAFDASQPHDDDGDNMREEFADWLEQYDRGAGES